MRCVVVALSLLIGFLCPHSASAQAAARRGLVVDQAGAPVAGAELTIESAQGAVLREILSEADGSFTLAGLPRGSYIIEARAEGFAARRSSLALGADEGRALRIELAPAPLRGEATVTASRGQASEASDAASLVIVRAGDDLRTLPTIGSALEASPGVLVQQSTHGQVSPFLRGLTGYQVLNLIDGVRFNNSTFRAGPNQYLALVEPSQVERVEALLGPLGASYGSDALGGAINLLTAAPAFAESGKRAIGGEVESFGASADISGGARGRLTSGSERVALLLGGGWRRHNDLRAGGGRDSRHALGRFFGLDAEATRALIGARQRETGFGQQGWQAKLALRLAEDQNLSLSYQRSALEGVRGYKDLWGGLGRLRSDFRPQGLDFFYARYERLAAGFLDSLSATFSLNVQRDGTVRQGLRASDLVTIDESRVSALGYAGQATAHWGSRQAIVFGGEIYDERIGAARFESDPLKGATVERRALYPHGSRYTTCGLFAQDSVELISGRLRASFGGRWTRVAFSTFADRNLDDAGRSLGVVDAGESFGDLSYNASLSWQATGSVTLHAIASRGFRAPNLNDLGAVGLNDLGYEIPASAASGALIGASDGEGAPSSGRAVGELRAERLLNTEVGVAVRRRRFYARGQVFDAELRDPIVRRTLVFPESSVPAMLSGIAVTRIAPTPAQAAQGVVSVATPFDARAVKAFVNEGRARYYGLEAVFHYEHYARGARWSIDGHYSYLVGRELDPNRPVRRLPPQAGRLAVRSEPFGFLGLGGRRPWIEVSGVAVGAQERLSGGDLSDERIGAARRRRDIADFFRGARAGPLVESGADGIAGTSDDRLRLTGETLSEIVDRVLPLGAVINSVRVIDDNTRVPLYLATAGYATINLRMGVAVSERVSLQAAIENLLDHNYRIHGSGVDAPGINVIIGVKVSF